MKVFIGKANLESEKLPSNVWEWECIVFAFNEDDACKKVMNEIKTSPHMMDYVSNILDVNIEEVAVIA